MMPSHVGLGHVARDLAIARALRKAVPRLSIEWLTAEPAVSYLRMWGERILKCSEDLDTFSRAVEGVFNIHGFRLNELREYLRILRRNYRLIIECVDLGGYDLVFADEFWELMLEAPKELLSNVAFATDLAFMPYGGGVRSSIVNLILNHYFRRSYLKFRRRLYLNSLKETPNCRWYLISGCRVREWIRRNFIVTGLTTSYLPWEIPGREETRKSLGINNEVLVVSSVGGTSARSSTFLSRIIEAIKYLRGELGVNAELVLVKGPRTGTVGGEDLEWVRSYGLVKSMLNLYVAADLMIVRPGRTTTADLECLPIRVKALLAPIKGHVEQEHIAEAVSRRFPNSFKVIREDEDPRVIALKAAEALKASLSESVRCEDCLGVINVANYILNELGLSSHYLPALNSGQR